MNRLYKYTDFSHAVNNSNRDGRTSGEYVCEAYVVPFEKGQILLHTPQEALKRAAKSYYSFLPVISIVGKTILFFSCIDFSFNALKNAVLLVALLAGIDLIILDKLIPFLLAYLAAFLAICF